MSGKPYKLVQIDEVRWEIPRTGGMRVPGLIFTDSRTLPDIEKDESPDQVYNVAHLPGIVGRSMAMPDVHWGYGFPIGGVAAFDADEGVVSPGGVGYDINCGVRLAVTGLDRQTVANRIRELIDALFAAVPSGLGSRGGIKLNRQELSAVLKAGAEWAVKQGMGEASDLERVEEHGCLEGADPSLISDRSFERGKDQLGTLGSGNHFLEIGYIEEIFDQETAQLWGRAARSGHRDDSHRITRIRVSGMRRISCAYGQERHPGRHQFAGQAACLHPIEYQPGKRISLGNGRGRQLRIRQSPDSHAPHANHMGKGFEIGPA